MLRKPYLPLLQFCVFVFEDALQFLRAFLEEPSKIGSFWRSPPELVCFGGLLQNWCVLEESSRTGAFWRTPPKLVRFGGVLQNWSVLEEDLRFEKKLEETRQLGKPYLLLLQFCVFVFEESSISRCSFLRSPLFCVFVLEEKRAYGGTFLGRPSGSTFLFQRNNAFQKIPFRVSSKLQPPCSRSCPRGRA